MCAFAANLFRMIKLVAVTIPSEAIIPTFAASFLDSSGILVFLLVLFIFILLKVSGIVYPKSLFSRPKSAYLLDLRKLYTRKKDSRYGVNKIAIYLA
jgi:hypothetical protein